MFENEFEKMLKKYGSSVDDKKKFSGLVKDYFNTPEDVKAVNLLLIAYDIGIVDDIKNTLRINNAFAYKYVKQLMEDYGLSRVNADWIVSIWCVCYGRNILGKDCELNIQQPGKGPAISEEKNPGKNYGDLFTYRQSKQGNGLAVSGFTGNKRQTIIFQNFYANEEVVEIGDGIFEGESIEEAIITDGISHIGKATFLNCEKLHQAVLPISIREIGNSAFEGCISLKSITLPELLERVGSNAFKGSGLRTIAFPKSLYYIGSGMLSECLELDNITIPSNIETIPESLFEGCINLKKIKLNDNLTTIEDRAFFGCKNLDFIIIPDSVKKIGDDAFTGTDKRFIVQCSFGSYAEEYCRKKKIKYQLV